MIDIPETAKRLYKDFGTTKKYFAVFRDNKIVLDNSKIMSNSLQITESICSSGDFKVGLCESSTFKLTAEVPKTVKDDEITIFQVLGDFNPTFEWDDDFGLSMSGEGIRNISQKFLVSFNSMGGSFVPTQAVNIGSTADEPTDPTYYGYGFDGWYTDTNYTTLYDFDIPVTQNVTLYAKWIALQTYTVVFNSNGGSVVNSQTVVIGDTAVQPVDPIKINYTFMGWYSDSELVYQYDFNTPVTSNITLYAKYDQIYTVTFQSNGGSSVPSQTVNINSYAIQPSDPTKQGRGFGGWYTNSSFTTRYNFSNPVTSNITLYAKWVIYPVNAIIWARADKGIQDTNYKYLVTWDSSGDEPVYVPPTQQQIPYLNRVYFLLTGGLNGINFHLPPFQIYSIYRIFEDSWFNTLFFALDTLWHSYEAVITWSDGSTSTVNEIISYPGNIYSNWVRYRDYRDNAQHAEYSQTISYKLNPNDDWAQATFTGDIGILFTVLPRQES